jgi:hypothetical protein
MPRRDVNEAVRGRLDDTRNREVFFDDSVPHQALSWQRGTQILLGMILAQGLREHCCGAENNPGGPRNGAAWPRMGVTQHESRGYAIGGALFHPCPRRGTLGRQFPARGITCS